MQIQEIMTSRIETVRPEATLREAARMMCDLNIGSLGVADGGELIGILTDRDICCRAVAEGKSPATTKVSEIMSSDVAYCFEDEDITDAAQQMENKHIRRLAVLNRRKQMVGLISVDDLAHYSHDLAGEVLEHASPLSH
jgi:predicted transcriptional regulator